MKVSLQQLSFHFELGTIWAPQHERRSLEDRNKMINRAISSFLCFCVLSQTATVVFADNSKAKAKFEEGIDALKKEDFLRALDAFEASYDITPKASVLYNIGMCQKAMFRYSDAKRSLERFLADKGSTDKSSHMVDTLSALEEIDARIGKVNVSVMQTGVAVHIDGREVGHTPLPESLLVDPGVHVIELTRNGFKRFVENVKIALGETITIQAEMIAEEPIAIPEPAALPPAESKLSSAQSKSHCPKTDPKTKNGQVLLIAGISALNLAVAGAVAGSIFTFKRRDEFAKTEALVDFCRTNPETACVNAYTYYTDKLDSDTAGIIAGFAASGALIIAGTTLLILRAHKRDNNKTVLQIGPNGISGSF